MENKLRNKILDTIDDLVADLMTCDRDELPIDEMLEALESGNPSIDEVVARFREALRQRLPG